MRKELCTGILFHKTKIELFSLLQSVGPLCRLTVVLNSMHWSCIQCIIIVNCLMLFCMYWFKHSIFSDEIQHTISIVFEIFLCFRSNALILLYEKHGELHGIEDQLHLRCLINKRIFLLVFVSIVESDVLTSSNL